MRALTREFSLLLLFAVAGVVLAIGPRERVDAQSKDDRPGDVERGRYLVEEVAKCPECHTPRRSDGQLDSGQWLRGASIWINPVKRIPNWAEHAPPLAGLPSFSDAGMENVLQRGIGPNGEAIRPPMHIYHMNAGDAKAIVAYLKSLPKPIH
jgi:mono/diheme cytochrome c family protein